MKCLVRYRKRGISRTEAEGTALFMRFVRMYLN